MAISNAESIATDVYISHLWPKYLHCSQNSSNKQYLLEEGEIFMKFDHENDVTYKHVRPRKKIV